MEASRGQGLGVVHICSVIGCIQMLRPWAVVPLGCWFQFGGWSPVLLGVRPEPWLRDDVEGRREAEGTWVPADVPSGKGAGTVWARYACALGRPSAGVLTPEAHIN